MACSSLEGKCFSEWPDSPVTLKYPPATSVLNENHAPDCSPYIFYGDNKQNLLNNQKLFHNADRFLFLTTFIFD